MYRPHPKACRPGLDKPALGLRASRQPGWTLTEMMVCLGLLGVLAALALPAYQEQQRLARRSDGQAALMRLQTDQARWRSMNETHADTLQALGWSSDLSPLGHYRIRVLAITPDGYTAQAIALGGQMADTACSPLQMRLQGGAHLVLGTEKFPDTDPARCWRK